MAEAVTARKTFVMVRVPGGTFTMGSNKGQGEPDEYPAHALRIDEFLIGRYLVTAPEWARFLNETGNPDFFYFEPSDEMTVVYHQGKYYARQDCTLHPANGVTWYGAETFTRWLAEKTGRPYRLPTEAEWEMAARCGLDSKRYPWGNDSAEGRARYQQTWLNPKHTITPVGSYPPNDFGLYDIAGNVWEWCLDWYDPEYYQHSPEDNPQGPETGRMKVLRGGSWGALDIQIRCGIRVGEVPDISVSNIGFRLARSVE